VPRQGELTDAALATLAEQVADVVPRLYRLLRTALAEDPAGPSLEQLRVMQRIDEGLHNVSTIAAVRQMRMSAITAVLDVLVERGWVDRHPDPLDRRRVHVDLTTPGRRALRRGRRLTTRRIEEIIGKKGLPADLAPVIAALVDAVNQYDEQRRRITGGAPPAP
jgi:DNA-binding MarR family transcriptional regulator